MRAKTIGALLLVMLLLTGCWDRLELEDQLFVATITVDKGERSRYRITARVPVAAAMKAGVLGGQGGGKGTTQFVSAEADTVVQAMYIINASVARRITLRHLRGVGVGEELAREGLHDLLAELMRNGEIHETAGIWVARGPAGDVLQQAAYTGEVNPGKINEGLLLVEKGVHMAPPIRLHHMINRQPEIGVDPFAPAMGLNPRITRGEVAGTTTKSAVAGELDRVSGNPVEIAGTAVFQGDKLAGFLTVDETQALLALRGEMGKAYMTFPDPLNPGTNMTVRFQQENKPKVQTLITPQGPRATVRLLFEGEVLSGDANYRDPAELRKVEVAAARFMNGVIEGLLTKTRSWGADPVGYGLYFRSKFLVYGDWERFRWRDRIGDLQVQVSSQMRLRRFGLIHAGPPKDPGKH